MVEIYVKESSEELYRDHGVVCSSPKSLNLVGGIFLIYGKF